MVLLHNENHVYGNLMPRDIMMSKNKYLLADFSFSENLNGIRDIKNHYFHCAGTPKYCDPIFRKEIYK